MLRIAGSIACRSCSADWTFQPMNGYHGKEVCRLSFDSLCSVAHQRLFFINQCLDYWLVIWSRSASSCIFSSFSCPLDVYRCESLKSNKFYFLCDLFCLRSHFGHTPDLKQILWNTVRHSLHCVECGSKAKMISSFPQSSQTKPLAWQSWQSDLICVRKREWTFVRKGKSKPEFTSIRSSSE